jgi:subtilisin family serine protease
MGAYKWIRRLGAVALALALLAQIMPAQAAGRPQGFVDGEVLVWLQASADPRAFEARTGLKLQDQLPGLPFYRFSIVDGLNPRLKAASVAAQPGVLAAEPNFSVLSPWATRRVTWVVGSDAEGYATQWAPQVLGLPQAHIVSKGSGVTVAILDTGADAEHPALAGHLGPGYDFIANDSDPREEGSADTDAAFGHGTHVAGLVAMVAPEAHIVPLRTLHPDGSGDLWTQVVAMQYAFQQGAGVINLSFSFGERSRIFDEIIRAVSCGSAVNAFCRGGKSVGAVVVAAAGNTGAAVREFPGASALPGLLGVAASTKSDTLASFSTFGSWLPLAAPGEEVVSSVPGGGYAAWSGTSMATPIVAGTVALVRSVSPLLAPAEAAHQVVDSATKIDARVRRRVNAAASVGAPAP